MSLYIYFGLLLFVALIRKMTKATSVPKKDVVGNHEKEPIQSAEIHGAAWEAKSVFEHIERGMTENTEAIAVVSLFQPANHLESLGIKTHSATHDNSLLRKVEQAVGSNGLWQKKRDQLHEGWIQDNQMDVNDYRNGISKEYSHNGNSPNGHMHAPNGYHNGHSNDGINGDNKPDLLWVSNRQPGNHGHLSPPSSPGASPRLSGPSSCGVKPADYLTLTYKQLHTTATSLSAGLLADGCSTDTTMVMLIPNGAEFTLLLYTCVVLRVTYVCLDPGLLDISGFTLLKHFMRTLKPQIVVAPDTVAGRAVEVAVSELRLPVPRLVSLSGATERPGWKSLADIAAHGSKAIAGGVVSDVELINAARRDSVGRIHSIMFTSGTSGLPKGCPLRVGGMSHALDSQSWLLDDSGGGKNGHHQHPPVRALMQPHNSRGIAPAQTLQTWRAGGSVVLTGQAFNVQDAISAITRVRATFVVLTPPMVHEMAAFLAARPGLDVASVRTIQVGGDTVTKGLLQSCERLFPGARVLVNHGMTEGPGAFMWPSRFSRMSVGQLPFYGESVCPVGSVAPGAAVRICDVEQGAAKVLVRRDLGEMHVSCPSVIGHYWNGRSDDSFYTDSDGRRWFRTGDVALVDNEGTVFVVGRVNDIIRRAGVPIMPAPVESLIEEFTGAQVSQFPSPWRKHIYLSQKDAPPASPSLNWTTSSHRSSRIRQLLYLQGIMSWVQSLLPLLPHTTEKVRAA